MLSWGVTYKKVVLTINKLVKMVPFYNH